MSKKQIDLMEIHEGHENDTEQEFCSEEQTNIGHMDENAEDIGSIGGNETRTGDKNKCRYHGLGEVA